MLRFFLAVVGIVLATPAFCSTEAAKQRITPQQLTRIRADVTKTIERLALHLSFLASPDTDEADLSDAIQLHFAPPDNIFWDKEFEIDDDCDPDQSAATVHRAHIEEYLAKFHYRVKGRDAASVVIEIVDFSPVYQGENGMFIRVTYNQHFDANSAHGTAFPKQVMRVAYLRVERVGNIFRSFIAGLEFANAANVRTAGGQIVPIVDAQEEPAFSFEQVHSTGYYLAMLRNGMEALKRDDFADAYYAFREARQYKGTEDEARKQLLQLIVDLARKKQEYRSTLGAALTEAGDRLAAGFQPARAIRYYMYAKEADPGRTAELTPRITRSAARSGELIALATLLRNSATEEAVRAHRSAVEIDNANPALLVGLARAYQLAGSDSAAAAVFQTALRTAPGYPEALQAYGAFLTQRRNFKAGLEYFVKYQLIAEDGTEPGLLAQIAFAKGMQLIGENQLVFALDSFRSALSYLPHYREARLGEAEVFLQQRDFRAARKAVGRALAIDGKFADAFFLQARILQAESGANKPAVIRAYRRAVDLQPGSAAFQWELGKILMDDPDDDYSPAIRCFSACIRLCGNRGLGVQAYWKRGKCYLMQRKLAEAEADFEAFEKLAYVKPAAFLTDCAALRRLR